MLAAAYLFLYLNKRVKGDSRVGLRISFDSFEHCSNLNKYLLLDFQCIPVEGLLVVYHFLKEELDWPWA